MKRYLSILGLGLAAIASQPAAATVIYYEANQLNGNSWQVDYEIQNDTLLNAIESFTLFFNQDLYSNIAVLSAPAGWDLSVIQPDISIPDDGYVDGIAGFGGAIPLNGILAGIRVTFDFLGAGAPGTQFFEMYDPDNYFLVDSGNTIVRPSTPVPVPEPSMALLHLLIIIGLSTLAKRRSKPIP